MDQTSESELGTFQQLGYRILPSFLSQEECDPLLSHALKRSKEPDTTCDQQSPGSPAFYADPLMERLLERLTPRMGALVGVPVYPTYSYFRVYRKGATLGKHVDRPPCEFSMTISLGYEAPQPWPIWFAPYTKDAGVVKVYPTALRLEKGDAAVYRGTKIPHWRHEFEGKYAAQVFLHYVDQNGPNREWKFDKREKLNTA